VAEGCPRVLTCGDETDSGEHRAIRKGDLARHVEAVKADLPRTETVRRSHDKAKGVNADDIEIGDAKGVKGAVLEIIGIDDVVESNPIGPVAPLELPGSKMGDDLIRCASGRSSQ
jgi:hypothetical protein